MYFSIYIAIYYKNLTNISFYSAFRVIQRTQCQIIVFIKQKVSFSQINCFLQLLPMNWKLF